MAVEIERKFLVTSDAWRRQAHKHGRMRQGYLSRGGSCSIRVRVAGNEAWLNIKRANPVMVREEFEYVIPLADAEQMLANLCSGPLIEKTRYWVQHKGHVWEIDVFEGANAGLIVAEIELADPAESFSRPDWLGAEVTDDPRYYNVALAEHPYREWVGSA